MIARETRVLLRHYLEQGVSKAAARKLGTADVYRWIRQGNWTSFGRHRLRRPRVLDLQEDHRHSTGGVSGTQRRARKCGRLGIRAATR